jgi:hypothetical protein
MASDHMPFPARVQKDALARQRFLCASCGTPIATIGEAGQTDHRFGERAEGHHVIPHTMGGPVTVENCVVVCRACHYSVHHGGRWRDISIYKDVFKLPMPKKIAKIAKLYPHYRG